MSFPAALFWTSGNISSGFQSYSGHLTEADLSHVTHFLRFTSGAMPANLLVARMAAEPFSSMYLKAGIGGIKTWTYPRPQCETCQADILKF